MRPATANHGAGFDVRRTASAVTAALGLLLLLALAGCSRAAPDKSHRPVVTIAPVAEAVVADDPLRFRVSAAPEPQADLTVSVTIASDHCELSEPPDSVIIGAGKSQATLTVNTSGATVGAQRCVVTATIAAGDGYAVGEGAGAAARATLTMQPVVTIADGDRAVPEGDPVLFTLTAAPAPAADLAVNVELSESGSFLTASTSRARTVTISASARTATLTAETENDDTTEQDGSVTATVGPGKGYTVGARKSATVKVTDDDPTTRSPGPVPPGSTTSGPATRTPATPGQPTPRSGPEDTTPTPPPTPTPKVTISAPDATAHSILSHAIVVSVDEGEATSFTLTAMPAPESELTVTLSWSFAGDLASPPVNTDLMLTPRPATVTIPTSGAASFTVTVGSDNQKNKSLFMTDLVSVWPGDGYQDGVPHRLFFRIEDDD